MAASNADKFKKGARKWVGQIGAGGVADASVATIPLSSTTGLPTDTAVVAVIDRVTSTGTKTPLLEETVVGVVSGNNLVTCTRGAEGTAQAHAAGSVVEIVITNLGWNDIVDGILVGHNQDGTHKSGSVLTLPQINDTSSDHQYVIAVNELAADRTVTLPLLTGADEFVFKDHAVTMANKTFTSPVLNGDVTGTGVLDEDTMTTNSSTKLATQQSIKAYVDSKVNTDGWVTVSDTWTYASASTFTIAGVDRTSTFTKGTRLKFVQTTTKYAVVVASSFSTNTTVTIAVNTDYVIANAAISDTYYSYDLSPTGYPNYFSITPSTSNITGFSSVAGYVYRYSIVGQACTVTFQIGGTSNAANFIITAPCTIISASGLVNTPVAVQDNGTWQSAAGVAAPNPASTQILIGKTLSTIAAGAYAGFTTSGSKFADGCLTFYF